MDVDLSTILREVAMQREYKRGVKSLGNLKKEVKKEWVQVVRNQNLT